MNIDNSFLQTFVGGIWYFRFPCFEKGPDWYYLFRSRIVSIGITEDKGLALQLQTLPLNRFVAGSWTEHEMDEHVAHLFKPGLTKKDGVEVLLPDFCIISPTIVHITCDTAADAVMYANESEQPDELHSFAHFPEGHEKMAGLGSLDIF